MLETIFVLENRYHSQRLILDTMINYLELFSDSVKMYDIFIRMFVCVLIEYIEIVEKTWK